ncbi:MAG TPA: AAA family ATPase [Alphaproteobacteria bacterium]|nr:AAA family ATPase [Alphaproteobacteria bacterium]
MLPFDAHAFVSSDAARDLLAGAFADRRLAKGRYQPAPGGIPEAVERYKSSESPPLLVIEVAGRDGLFDGLAALAEVCAPQTHLVLLGPENDIELYRRLTALGVADYLVLGAAGPARLAEAVTALFAKPGGRPQGRVVACIGAKGGVGSSTLAHNLAHALAPAGAPRSLLIDLDLAFGTADLNCNLESAQGIARILADPARIDEMLLGRFAATYQERVDLLSANPDLALEGEVPAEGLERILAVARDNWPAVVLDLPHQWTEWLRGALLAADEVVVTATLDLAALRNAKALFRWLGQRRGGERPALLVVGRSGAARRTEIALRDFESALGAKAAAVLPEEPQIWGQAANDGRMLAEVAPKGAAAAAIAQLAAQLAPPPRGGARARPGALALPERLQRALSALRR